MNKIKPIDGQRVGHFNEVNEHDLFLLAIKINELVQAVNKLEDAILKRNR